MLFEQKSHKSSVYTEKGASVIRDSLLLCLRLHFSIFQMAEWPIATAFCPVVGGLSQIAAGVATIGDKWAARQEISGKMVKSKRNSERLAT